MCLVSVRCINQQLLKIWFSGTGLPLNETFIRQVLKFHQDGEGAVGSALKAMSFEVKLWSPVMVSVP